MAWSKEALKAFREWNAIKKKYPAKAKKAEDFMKGYNKYDHRFKKPTLRKAHKR